MSNESAQDHTEVEWQFDAPEGLDRASDWLRAANVPGYTVQPGALKQLVDRYYDTPDWRLNHAGFTCRVRQKGDSAELTMKGQATSVDGMRSRREMNESVPMGEDDIFAIASGPVGAAVKAVRGRQPMQQLFTVRTARQLFHLSDDGGRIAEIAVDDTTVESETGAPGSLARIEVEVDPDGVTRAQRFVDLFVATARLGPASKSKFETALTAAGLTISPKSPDLGATGVNASMTAADAGFAIMRKQFGIFLANEASTRLGEDIEGLHDMRVAARRLRAAMSAFGAYLPPITQRYREQLGWVAAALGEVRDLDVQLEDMVAWRSGFDAQQAAALDTVEQLFRDRRTAARRRMLFALDSRRYEGFVMRFSRFLERGPLRTFLPGRQPLVQVAPQLLERRYKKLRKLGDAIEKTSPPEEYHILRIAGKKLRYALEFMGPVYGADSIAFSQRVTALQDVLGRHQDAEVVIEALQELGRTQGRRLAPPALLVMGAISERNRVEAARLRGEFPRVYKPLSGAEWTRLRKDFTKQARNL
ncbi:hypothetical protein AYO38_08135 [bacterium SCGC AG-212-C10]|nr:hypothetical protein AYO38_08135 [bacterium SCGC AG-212-C10]